MNGSDSMYAKSTNCRRSRLWVSNIFLILVVLANLAVLWFALYKILPLTLFALGLLLCTALRPLARPSFRRVIPGGVALFVVYMYMGISTAWAPNPEVALNEFGLILLAIIPALFFGYFYGSRFTIDEIGLAFCLIPFIFLFQALYNIYATGDSMLIGDLSMRSLLGGVACMMTPLLMGAFLGRRRVMVGGAFFISLVLVISIQSRSSIIIVLPVLLFMAFKYSRRLFFATLLIGGLLVFSVIAFNVEQITERFATKNTSFDISEAVLDEANKPVESRVDFDRRLAAFVSAQLFLENPWLGGGYSSVLQESDGVYGVMVVSHGFLPGTAGELGLLGLGVILVFFYQLYRMGWYANCSIVSASTSITSIGFWYGLVALIMYGFFHQTFESAIFGVVVGVAFGLTATAPGARLNGCSS